MPPASSGRRTDVARSSTRTAQDSSASSTGWATGVTQHGCGRASAGERLDDAPPGAGASAGQRALDSRSVKARGTVRLTRTRGCASLRVYRSCPLPGAGSGRRRAGRFAPVHARRCWSGNGSVRSGRPHSEAEHLDHDEVRPAHALRVVHALAGRGRCARSYGLGRVGRRQVPSRARRRPRPWSCSSRWSRARLLCTISAASPISSRATSRVDLRARGGRRVGRSEERLRMLAGTVVGHAAILAPGRPAGNGSCPRATARQAGSATSPSSATEARATLRGTTRTV